MLKSRFPEGIEVVGSVIIENKNGKVLLARSPKWNNKWVLPGGHIEPGEKLVDALIREGKEETGLRLKPVAVVGHGELINSNDFHRPAHFIYFDVYCKAVGGRLKLNEELSKWAWVKPKEALKLDLAESYPRTLKDFIAYKKSR